MTHDTNKPKEPYILEQTAEGQRLSREWWEKHGGARTEEIQ